MKGRPRSGGRAVRAWRVRGASATAGRRGREDASHGRGWGSLPLDAGPDEQQLEDERESAERAWLLLNG
jgi:hypothetical protein